MLRACNAKMSELTAVWKRAVELDDCRDGTDTFSHHQVTPSRGRDDLSDAKSGDQRGTNARMRDPPVENDYGLVRHTPRGACGKDEVRMVIGKKTKLARPPAHLSAEMKKFWRRTVETFVFEEHELRQLQLACEHLDGADQARRQYTAEGRTYLDARGKPRPHPCVGQHRDHSIAAARILRELRLSEPANDARPPRIAIGAR